MSASGHAGGNLPGAWRDPGLDRIERPARYVGGEWGSRFPARPAGAPLVVVAYADLYEVGAARLVLRWLCGRLQGLVPHRAERCFLPAPDRIDDLRRRGLPLTTLESGRPLEAAQLILLVVDHPLQAAQAAQLLELGGLEPLAARRSEGHPPVLGLGLPGTASGAWDALVDEGDPWIRLSGELARGDAELPDDDAGPAALLGRPAPHLYARPVEGPARLPWSLPGADPFSPRTPAALVDRALGAAAGEGLLEGFSECGAWIPEPALARLADELAAASEGGERPDALWRRAEQTALREVRIALCHVSTAALEGVPEPLAERLAAAGRSKLGADVVIGAPDETDAGVLRTAEALADLADRWRRSTGDRLQLEVELRPAAPWGTRGGAAPAPPWPVQELQRRLDALRSALPSGFRVRRRPPAEARTEGLLARSGAAGGPALVDAARRLVGPAWSDPGAFGRLFEESLRAHGLDPEALLQRDGGDPVPPTARTPAAPTPAARPAARVRPGPAAPAPPIYRYRLGFAKLGPARWLGHLDLLRALRLGLVRSGACAAMTRAEAGDRLRIVSSPALPIGVASRAEYVDLEMDGPLPIGWDPDNADGCLPRGLSFGGLVPLPLRARAIQDVVRLATYRARLGELGDDEGARAADRFTREKAVTVNRQRKGKVQTLDIRPQVSGLRFRPPGVLEFSIALAPSGSPRPTEVLEAVVGADLADPLRIERTELLARIGGRWVSPLLAARRSRKLEPS